MNHILLIVAMVMLSIQVQAQKSFTIATDPLTIPALNGFQIEGGFSFGKNRITANFLKGELSPWYNQAEDFKETNSQLWTIGYARWLNNNQKGLNFGVNFNYFSNFEVENNSNETLDKQPMNIALRVAYAWFPFKNTNFFVEPAINFGFMIRDKDLNFASGENFEKLGD